MNRTQLHQNFDTLAETLDAVAKLRGLILELAVRGKLVSNENSLENNPAWPLIIPGGGVERDRRKH